MHKIKFDFGDGYRTRHGWHVCIADIDCFLGC